MTPVIQASRLVKRYAGVEALAALDLTVEAGEVVALLGPRVRSSASPGSTPQSRRR